MKLASTITLPAVGLTGFETPLSEEERVIQDSLHRFARDGLRPLGRELDRMSASEVAAPGSPYYSVFAEAARLGLDSGLLGQLPPDMAIRIESMLGEEMGWGDAGLAISLTVTNFPLEMASARRGSRTVPWRKWRSPTWSPTTATATSMPRAGASP